MATAKDLRVSPISSSDANNGVKRWHYSGSVVNNSQLHFGVFLGTALEGVMSFGPPMVKQKLIGLVSDTKWNGFLELNRMAFSERLPKNSESRALGVALRLIKKHYTHIEWVVSFADATQCGDGTIYRASGFSLIKIKKNNSLLRLPNGEIVTNMTIGKGKHALKNSGRSGPPAGTTKLAGFQLQYIYFVNPLAKCRLTVPVIPFAEIKRQQATMYKGQRAGSIANDAPGFQSGEDGATPISALQNQELQQDSSSKISK